MSISGAEIVYAFKKTPTWGTSGAAGVGDGFLGLPITADPDNGLVVDDSLGQYFAVDASPGQTKLEPSVPAYLRFNDEVLWSIIAMFFGTAGVPSTHSAGTVSKDHTLKINKKLDGLFATLCANLGATFVEEIPSWKPAKLVFTFETGKPVQVAISGPGFDLVTDSSINTTTTMNSVTILERANRVYMAQTEFRMNDQSAIALAVGDKIGPTKAVLTLERKLTGVYGSYVSAGPVPRDLIDEPTNDGAWTSSLSLTFPRLTNANGRADIKGNVSKKAEIICTGPIIEGAIPYLVRFQMPHLKPKKNSNPHKQGILENVREYEVLGATVAPAGMTGNTDPCWLLLTNQITTDLLA